MLKMNLETITIKRVHNGWIAIEGKFESYSFRADLEDVIAFGATLTEVGQGIDSMIAQGAFDKPDPEAPPLTEEAAEVPTAT